MTTATRERSDVQTETASSVSWMREWERDPAAFIRKQFAAITAQNEREVEAAAKAKRNDELRAAYVARRPEDAA